MLLFFEKVQTTTYKQELVQKSNKIEASIHPAGNYVFQVYNGNIRRRCENVQI